MGNLDVKVVGATDSLTGGALLVVMLIIVIVIVVIVVVTCCLRGSAVGYEILEEMVPQFRALHLIFSRKNGNRMHLLSKGRRSSSRHWQQNTLRVS